MPGNTGDVMLGVVIGGVAAQYHRDAFGGDARGGESCAELFLEGFESAASAGCPCDNRGDDGTDARSVRGRCCACHGETCHAVLFAA